MKRRTSKVKLVAKSVSLEPAEWARLRAMADVNGTTVSRLIGELLKPFL